MRSKIPYWPLLAGPYLMLAVGFLLNAIVIAANHGQMPVQCIHGSDKFLDGNPIHACMVASSHLKFLSDWVLINGLGIASPGDFLMWAYEIVLTPFTYIWALLMIIDSNR